MLQVITDIMAERARQDAKWGEQNHTPIEWLAVLTEEVDEVAQETLRLRFGGNRDDDARNYRAEMVQVAAVAIAALECLDRNA